MEKGGRHQALTGNQPPGQAGPDDRDLIIRGLRTEIADKDEQIRKLRAQVGVIEDGVRSLRGVLNPFHQFLLRVFGEMDAIGITEGVAHHPAAAIGVPGVDGRWESIKKQVPPRLAAAIDVLLVHGSMSTAQLAANLHIKHGNCKDNIVAKLAARGLLVRDGREFRLKDL